MGDLDQLEGCLVHALLESFVTVPVAVGFLGDDAAFQQQAFQHQPDVEDLVPAFTDADGDIFEIAKQCKLHVVTRFLVWFSLGAPCGARAAGLG